MQARPQPRFMAPANSSLVLMCLILSSMNSIATSSSIGCGRLRRIHAYCSRSASISSSSRRVPERLMRVAWSPGSAHAPARGERAAWEVHQ